jgi:hypothetical protein
MVGPSSAAFSYAFFALKGRFWRKADIEVYLNLDQFVPFAGATSILFVMDESKFFTKPHHH